MLRFTPAEACLHQQQQDVHGSIRVFVCLSDTLLTLAKWQQFSEGLMLD
jgi:hypothetical protein